MPENRGLRTPEPFESEHHVRSRLDVSMILLDHVIQMLRGAHVRSIRQQSVSDHLPHGPVQGGIPIERDRRRWLALVLDGLAEEGFGRAHVALRPEHEVSPAGKSGSQHSVKFRNGGTHEPNPQSRLHERIP